MIKKKMESVFSHFAFGLFLSSPVLGQDALRGLPALPSGFYEAASTRIDDESNFGEWDFSVGLSMLYDSNVTQGSPGGVREEESDFLIQPSLDASYQIGAKYWELGGRGSVSRLSYLETEDFNTTIYSLGTYGKYQSNKLTASFDVGFASNGGVNRLAGNFIEQQTFSTNFAARYRFSGKASASLSWNQSLIESNTEGFADTSSTTLGVSAVWRASPLLNIGPGFRYGVRTGSDDEEFVVAGPTLNADYKLSTKVKLRSSIGLDFTDSPYVDKDQLLAWSVSMNYRASSLWGFDLAMIQDTQATLISGGGFDQTSSYRFSYWRKLRRARLQLGLSLEDREPQDSAGTSVGFRDSTYVRYTASLGFPVLREEVDLNLTLGWQDFSAADDSQSWDGFQSGLSLRWNF
jgi:hypothetical protein